MRELVCIGSGSILINRSPCGLFSSSSGSHQGDPLSPYLFILSEEILGINVEALRLDDNIVPISPVQSTPCHLLYLDDILLLLKAANRSFRSLKGLLSLYQDSSGL